MSELNIDYNSLLLKHVTCNIMSICHNQYSVSNILKAAAKAKFMKRRSHRQESTLSTKVSILQYHS